MKNVNILFFIFIIGCKSKVTNTNLNFPDFKTRTSINHSCSFQNDTDIGVGVLIWGGNCEDSLILHDNSGRIQNRINICENSFIDEQCPLLFKPDYGIFHINVIEKLKSAYLCNLGSSEYLLNYDIQGFTFVTWENYFQNYVLEVRNSKENEVIKVLYIEGFDLYGTTTEADTVIIKWRDKNKILVELIPLI
jgi:hypothetical protein